MISLNANPAGALKDGLTTKGVTTKIYINGETPSSGLPAEFIDINQNGSMSSLGSQLGTGTARCNLLVSIYVKLLSTDTVNYVKENAILGVFQSLFESAVVKSGFSFTIDKDRMVYSGKSIISGYSTKILNIKVNF